MDNIVEEFSQIKPSMIDKILEYLETGKFEGQISLAFVTSYSKVVELADIDGNGEYLYMYYITK